jgi:Ca-activated chloride channel family protein
MFFLWPHYLWLLWALPLLPLAYLWLLRRRSRLALRYSSLHVVRTAASAGWKRHLPPALLLLACAGLLLAAARPVAQVPLPWARTTIMLAIDVSLSMRVTDVQPSRLEAAQDAARQFLRELPAHIDVGLVTFAGSTHVARQRHGSAHRCWRRSTPSRCRSAPPWAARSSCAWRSFFRTTVSTWAR